MATFLVLIYGDEQKWAAMSREESSALDDGHRSLAEAAGSAIIATGELEPPDRARTLQRGAAPSRPAPSRRPRRPSAATT